MEKRIRVVDTPVIEAKKIFSEVIDYEFKLINYISKGEFEPSHGVTNINKYEYYKRFYKEYVKLFLARAKIIERRINK